MQLVRGCLVATLLILQVALLQPTLAQTSPSQVYRWTDEAGRVHYSQDKPPGGARVATIDTPPPATGASGPAPTSPASSRGFLDMKTGVWMPEGDATPTPGLKPGQLPPRVPPGPALFPGSLPPPSDAPPARTGLPGSSGSRAAASTQRSAATTDQAMRPPWPQGTAPQVRSRTISRPYPEEVPVKP